MSDETTLAILVSEFMETIDFMLDHWQSSWNGDLEYLKAFPEYSISFLNHRLVKEWASTDSNVAWRLSELKTNFITLSVEVMMAPVSPDSVISSYDEKLYFTVQHWLNYQFDVENIAPNLVGQPFRLFNCLLKSDWVSFQSIVQKGIVNSKSSVGEIEACDKALKRLRDSLIDSKYSITIDGQNHRAQMVSN